MLASGHTKRKKILISGAVHPESSNVLKTYATGQHIEVEVIPELDGKTDIEALKKLFQMILRVLLYSIQTSMDKWNLWQNLKN